MSNYPGEGKPGPPRDTETYSSSASTSASEGFYASYRQRHADHHLRPRMGPAMPTASNDGSRDGSASKSLQIFSDEPLALGRKARQCDTPAQAKGQDRCSPRLSRPRFLARRLGDGGRILFLPYSPSGSCCGCLRSFGRFCPTTKPSTRPPPMRLRGGICSIATWSITSRRSSTTSTGQDFRCLAPTTPTAHMRLWCSRSC